MNRREAIERTAMILGYAISAPALAGILSGCKTSPTLNYKPVFFNEAQAALIGDIAEIILPKTTTPGAKDAGVPQFIDTLVYETYSQEDKDKFLASLKGFNEASVKSHGSDFNDLSDEKKKEFVKAQHDLAFNQPVEGGSGNWWDSGSKQEKPFVLQVKELTLLGFFTSEPGATQVLQYNQVPGPFKGCVPLSEVGKTWAT
jgi:gluconate 2-dehydrogenase gamma chain